MQSDELSFSCIWATVNEEKTSVLDVSDIISSKDTCNMLRRMTSTVSKKTSDVSNFKGKCQEKLIKTCLFPVCLVLLTVKQENPVLPFNFFIISSNQGVCNLFSQLSIFTFVSGSVYFQYFISSNRKKGSRQVSHKQRQHHLQFL